LDFLSRQCCSSCRLCGLWKNNWYQ